MRKFFFLIIITSVFIYACSRHSGIDRNYDRHERKVRKEVLKIAETYATGNLSDAKKRVLENGLITFGNDQKTYVIDPAKIFFGQIDADTIADVIVSMYPFQGNFEVTTEHLIIINSNGRLMLIRALESDMKIISVKDGIITAEIPEHSRNSPLFNCPSCWEVVKYRFINGELTMME